MMISDEADEAIGEPIDSLQNRYENNFEAIKGSDSVLDYVYLMYYKYHKINLNRGRWYNDIR